MATTPGSRWKKKGAGWVLTKRRGSGPTPKLVRVKYGKGLEVQVPPYTRSATTFATTDEALAWAIKQGYAWPDLPKIRLTRETATVLWMIGSHHYDQTRSEPYVALRNAGLVKTVEGIGRKTDLGVRFSEKHHARIDKLADKDVVRARARLRVKKAFDPKRRGKPHRRNGGSSQAEQRRKLRAALRGK